MTLRRFTKTSLTDHQFIFFYKTFDKLFCLCHHVIRGSAEELLMVAPTALPLFSCLIRFFMKFYAFYFCLFSVYDLKETVL